MSPAKKLQLSDFEGMPAVLGRLPVFRDFPSELMDPLVSVSECLEIPKDKPILSQGQINSDIYFLVEGKASIFVDGGLVGKIEGFGDLLGEMSVIKRQPIGATIIADSDVRLVCVKTNMLLDTSEELRPLYQSVLYCLFSHVLVDKLEVTNNKAKQFEETNVRLKVAEMDLKTLNATLEERVQEKSQAIEARLGDLQEQILTPLKNHPQIPADIHGKVLEAIDLLEPIRSSLKGSLKLKGQSILCVDGVKKNQLSLKLALGGTGAILNPVLDETELKAHLAKGPYALILLDKSFLSHLSQIRVSCPNTPVLLFLEGSIGDEFKDMESLGEDVHFIFRSGDKKSQIQNILSSVTKILTHSIFGMDPYMGFGVQSKQKRITSSDARAGLIEEMDEHLSQGGVRPSYRDRAKLVVEELLMNAIYDAPSDAVSKKALFNHLPRTEVVSLAANQQGWLTYSFDGVKICLSVRDPFGSLSADVIFRYLKNSYSDNPQDLNSQEGKGGAGRGLHQIVEASDELIFNIAPGKKTEVISIIYLEKPEDFGAHPLLQLFLDSSSS